MKLFVQAGQSNIDGRGDLVEFPAGVPAYGSQIWNYRYNGTWTQNPSEPISDKTGSVYAIFGGAEVGVGPSLVFADRLCRYRTTIDVGLVPCAKGATAISEWARPVGGTDTATLYGASRARWEAALASAPGGSQIAGLVWYQGESDTSNNTEANAWDAAFSQLCNDWRTDIGDSNLPIVFVQIGPRADQGSFPSWTLLQSNQAKISGIGRTMMVSAADLTLKAGDNSHINTASHVILGRRIADAFRVLGAAE